MKNKSAKARMQAGKLIKTLIASAFLIVVVSAFLSASCTRTETAHGHDSYTCPMHPTVVSDRPGTCPVCGMDLVRKARAGEEVEITQELSALIKSPNETVVATIHTVRGEYKSIPVQIPAQGIVTYDTRNISTISARVGGRLEKVYLDYVFQPVAKGQKVAEVYSPELITAQREFLFLLENDPDNASLIDASRRKLGLLGMSSGQVNTIRQTRRVASTFAILSPDSGYIITDAQVLSASGSAQSPPASGEGMGDGMGSVPSRPTSRNDAAKVTSGDFLVREGDYVASGEKLFTIVNNNQLRIELNLPGSYTGMVKKGREIQLDLGDGRKRNATIDFIQPFFTDGQEFMKIRVYITQTQGLHIGHLVNGTIELDSTEGLWVPKQSVLDLGTRHIVFVKDRGVLKPKQVTVGITADGMTEIKDGLASSEEIAANAQYLVDSESFIKPVN